MLGWIKTVMVASLVFLPQILVADTQKEVIEKNFEIAKQFYGENDVVPRLTKTIRDDVNAES